MQNKNKKGDVTQTFMFLTAAIIMGVLLLFGGMSLFKLMNNAEEIKATEFRKNFEKDIDSVSSKYGSVNYVELSGLKEFSKMCVFEITSSTWTKGDCSVLDDFPLMRGDLNDNTANVFLLTNDGVGNRFLNEKVSLSKGIDCLCQEVSSLGVVTVKLEGLGKKTELSFEKIN